MSEGLEVAEKAGRIGHDLNNCLGVVSGRAELEDFYGAVSASPPIPFIQNHVIELAGGANIAADTKTAYPRLSMETVLKRNPDILLFPAGESETVSESQLAQWRTWSALSAVRHNRFVSVASDLLDRPGPRIVEGLERLAQVFHSDPGSSDPGP